MVWVLCWSGVACGGMPARDRADAAAVRDAWADGGSAAGALAPAFRCNTAVLCLSVAASRKHGFQAASAITDILETQSMLLVLHGVWYNV